MSYPEQAKAFLNAYFLESQVKDNAENIWQWAHLFGELDVEKKMQGADLDEFNAHRFLEKVGETKRVVELRDQLREIDLDFNKRMALIEYLLFRFGYKVADFVKRPQGDNSAELQKAQEMLTAVQKALEHALARAADAKAKAQAAKAAEDEQRAALAEVQAQEAAREAKTKDLTAKGEDMNLGAVARNKAKNELAQHLSEDPLPLRKAKITLEAATRKAEKARVAADAASAEADAAVVAADAEVAKAQAYLDEIASKSGSGGKGALWWLQRELDEKKKYMPKRKQ